MAQIGFEGFIEEKDVIQAYIEKGHYREEVFNLLVDELATLHIKVQFRFHLTEDQNWNEEWEKKFDPVLIDDQVLIRAPFHDSSDDRALYPHHRTKDVIWYRSSSYHEIDD